MLCSMMKKGPKHFLYKKCYTHFIFRKGMNVTKSESDKETKIDGGLLYWPLSS